MLNDADFLTEFAAEFSSIASLQVIDRGMLRRRLLLCLFTLAVNIGFRVDRQHRDHGETQPALRHMRRHFITQDNLGRAWAAPSPN